MGLYVVISTFIFVVRLSDVIAPPPMRLTIDCGSDEEDQGSIYNERSSENHHFNINSFCSLIHRAIPQAVHDGKFVLRESEDQTGFSDTQVPVIVPPPNNIALPKLSHFNFAPPKDLTLPKLPNFKLPRLKIPELKVPKLKSSPKVFKPPKIGSTMLIHRARNPLAEESSVERMEKFKKGVQKMLHVVKVLGQIDQYLSERTRIVVDKLSKTLAE